MPVIAMCKPGVSSMSDICALLFVHLYEGAMLLWGGTHGRCMSETLCVFATTCPSCSVVQSQVWMMWTLMRSFATSSAPCQSGLASSTLLCTHASASLQASALHRTGLYPLSGVGQAVPCLCGLAFTVWIALLMALAARQRGEASRRPCVQ